MIIKDYGCGIPEHKLNNLFINFTKIAENADKNKNGVGLGLSICKSLIEKMAGKVTVESKVGRGTTFTINFLTNCKSEEEQR